MADFASWDRATLVNFVVESNRRMQAQESQIADLRAQNKALLAEAAELLAERNAALAAWRNAVRSDVAGATVAT